MSYAHFFQGCTHQAVCQMHRKPLHPEWAEKAKKEIKGADPSQKLMWNTPEVSMCNVTGTLSTDEIYMKYI